jgi:hypothetical protein
VRAVGRTSSIIFGSGSRSLVVEHIFNFIEKLAFECIKLVVQLGVEILQCHIVIERIRHGSRRVGIVIGIGGGITVASIVVSISGRITAVGIVRGGCAVGGCGNIILMPDVSIVYVGGRSSIARIILITASGLSRIQISINLCLEEINKFMPAVDISNTLSGIIQSLDVRDAVRVAGLELVDK